MAILNAITRAEGTRGYPAMAVISVARNSQRTPTIDASREIGGVDTPYFIAGGKTQAILGAGSRIQVNVETFDQNGGSQGIQGLDFTVAGTEKFFDNTAGGFTPYMFLRGICEAIEQGWNPTVSCWATQLTPTSAVFNIQPRGSDGGKFPQRIEYQFVRIRDWILTPAAPTPGAIGGGGGAQGDCALSPQDIQVTQNAGSQGSPAKVEIKGPADAGDQYSIRVDTDVTDPVTLTVTAEEGDDCASIAEKFCAIINGVPEWTCETQNGVLYLEPVAPATAVSVGAAGIVHA